MTFGIIGAGGIGQAFARQLVRIGRDVMVSNSRGPETLAALRKELGPKIKPVSASEAASADAAAKAEVARLLEEIGFAPIDLGSLAVGGRLQQFTGGPLPGLNLIKLG